ncbi:hypothetical protein [Polynucleobacter cosmopolitanus]|nr:hypothetical protein [Polynucleobacter cosmopolitanus]
MIDCLGRNKKGRFGDLLIFVMLGIDIGVSMGIGVGMCFRLGLTSLGMHQ